MSQETGKWIIIVGGILLLGGIIIYFFHDKLSWFGNLPGDIKINKGNTRIYFPITTLILINLLIFLIMYLIRRFNT